jgi:3D (Asp-Asp-Asp) domain-containing protein
MRSFKRIVAAAVTGIVLLSTTIVASAETSQESIKNSQNQLHKNSEFIQQKEAEKQQVQSELQAVQTELQLIEDEVKQNKENIAVIKQNIEKTKQEIEQKKEEIVILEDKVHARKGVMEERLVSLHHSDQGNIFIEIIFNSDSLGNFIQRATAASTIINADKELLQQQQEDLERIEAEKRAIAQKEQALTEQYASLASTQAHLEQNLQKRQAELTAVQENFNKIASEINLAQKEKEQMVQQLNKAQENLKKEQQEAAERAQAIAKQEKIVIANSQPAAEEAENNTTEVNGKEIYVTATAYTASCNGCSGTTATGINLHANPGVKVIAVDPSIIPLGSRVYVEGYGYAVAADTGGAIKGHKIDVLMSSDAAALQWGRKTVKVVILN